MYFPCKLQLPKEKKKLFKICPSPRLAQGPTMKATFLVFPNKHPLNPNEKHYGIDNSAVMAKCIINWHGHA